MTLSFKTKQRLANVGWALAFAVSVFILWLTVTPARAQAVLPEKFVPHELPEPGQAMCYPLFGYCVTRMPDTIELQRCMMQAPRVIAGLQEQVKKLTEMKGCAKTEVTEPSKAPKPPPPIETKDRS